MCDPVLPSTSETLPLAHLARSVSHYRYARLPIRVVGRVSNEPRPTHFERQADFSGESQAQAALRDIGAFFTALETAAAARECTEAALLARLRQ